MRKVWLVSAGVILFIAAVPTYKSVKVDISKETPGTESKAFVSMVGDWLVLSEKGRNVMMEDGRPWKRGQPASSLADKARLEDVPLEMKKWHTMKIQVNGTALKGYRNDRLLLEYTLPELVSGRVGFWSKTDSVAYFDDYTVTVE